MALGRAVQLALKSLSIPESDDPLLVLVLIDSEGQCPAKLALNLLDVARSVDPRVDVACVLAHVMYETWFVAAAESLSEYLRLEPGENLPQDPEASGYGSSWVVKRFIEGPKYRKTQHQPAMTQAMDLNRCRAVSPSFDKLCRELEKKFRQEGREVVRS